MKRWLNENKIYFEIGSTFVFGIASVFVAVAANNVSESQLEIAKIQLEPLIFISEKYLQDDTGVATETFLEINNAGAPVYGFSVDTRTFYTVSTSSETIWIPVNGYYYATFELDAVDGKLAEVRGLNNNLAFGGVYSQQLKSDDDANLGYAELGRTTVTRVSYKARNKEVAEEYFSGEKGSDDPWVKNAFRLHRGYWPLEVDNLDWPTIVEATLKIRSDAPHFVRDDGF